MYSNNLRPLVQRRREREYKKNRLVRSLLEVLDFVGSMLWSHQLWLIKKVLRAANFTAVFHTVGAYFNYSCVIIKATKMAHVPVKKDSVALWNDYAGISGAWEINLKCSHARAFSYLKLQSLINIQCRLPRARELLKTNKRDWAHTSTNKCLRTLFHSLRLISLSWLMMPPEILGGKFLLPPIQSLTELDGWAHSANIKIIFTVKLQKKNKWYCKAPQKTFFGDMIYILQIQLCLLFYFICYNQIEMDCVLSDKISKIATVLKIIFFCLKTFY